MNETSGNLVEVFVLLLILRLPLCYDLLRYIKFLLGARDGTSRNCGVKFQLPGPEGTDHCPGLVLGQDPTHAHILVIPTACPSHYYLPPTTHSKSHNTLENKKSLPESGRNYTVW